MEYKVRLYEVNKYKKTLKFIKNSYTEYTLDEALEELQLEKGYHMRLVKNNQYIFFGDCDGFNGEFLKFSELLKDFLKKYYQINIKKKDISYTENKSKNGSFHYSIPSLYGYIDKILKDIHENFSKQYEELITTDKKGDKKLCIDTSVYGNMWFRMPNQKKESVNNTEHIVIRGDLKDFILDYIPKNSINIDNKKYIKIVQNPQKIIITDEYLNSDTEENNHNYNKKIIIKENMEKIKNDDDEEDFFKKCKNVDFIIIKECIISIDIKRANIYGDWIIVGMVLYNISSDEKYLKLWIEWSKNSVEKFKEGECEKRWKTFNKKNNDDKKYTFRTLMFMLKKDNKNKFFTIIKRLNIKNIIMERKKHFPNNELEIDNIILNNNSHYIQLADKFCPIIKGEHNKRYNYMEINKLGQLVLKCFCHECRGKEFPHDDILMLSKHELGTIFNLTQNNYITINNTTITNETNDPNKIYSEIIKLDPTSKIFDDIELNKIMIESLTASDAKIAKVICYLVKDKISCSKDKVWFEFKNHRWIESEYINTYISDELVNYYYKIILFINNSKEIQKDKTTSIKEIKKIIKILETKTRKANIIDEVGIRIRNNNPKFFENLDTSPYMIGFNNGVYDLNQMKFRDGKSEDMIAMSCNYDFKQEYSKYKDNLLTFLNDILPNNDDREYFLTYLSSALIGLNVCEFFTILTGKGRNGKSKLIDLISYTMGDYVGRPKCKLLTGTRPDENSPEPGLLSLKKKRIIMVSEPEQDDKLNSGFIKFLTGNDTETLRKCHKNKMEPFKANFLTFLVCNDIPNIDNMDNAFTKRLRCINFPTEFVPEPKLPNQKKIDETLQTKLVLWKNDFMLLLLEYYLKFNNGNLKPTTNILEWTTMYKEEVDIYLNFLNDCTEDSETHISNVQLYETFKIWFKQKFNNDKIPNNRGFLIGLRKHKNIEKTVWVDGKNTSGIKNLSIKNDYFEF